MPKELKPLRLFTDEELQERLLSAQSAPVLPLNQIAFIQEISSLLVRTVLEVAHNFECDRAAIMLVDPGQSALYAAKIYFHGQVMDGEEVISLEKESPLSRLIHRQARWLKVNKNCKYFLMQCYGQTLGVLRIEKDKGIKLRESEKKQISEFLEEASNAIWNTLLPLKIKEQSDELKVVSRIHDSVSQSLNIDDLLVSTVKTIQKVFSMDRVKIYICDETNTMLRGQISCDFRGNISSIEDESFSLKEHAHPTVDSFLGAKNLQLTRFNNVIRYIPLHARNERIGVLMVDNLLSQQQISDETIALLETVSGQIGLAIKNARLFYKIKELSITDGLTGLYLPRYFQQRVKEEVSRSERQASPLSMMILDLDNFKRINDTYGHPVGDKVLRLVASKILSTIRRFDIAARYGGDEFIVLMLGSNEADALHTAERILLLINSSSIRLEDGTYLNFTVSGGIASLPAHGSTDEELIHKADNALYEAKKAGRNRVMVYHPAGV